MTEIYNIANYVNKYYIFYNFHKSYAVDLSIQGKLIHDSFYHFSLPSWWYRYACTNVELRRRNTVKLLFDYLTTPV
jgi:hypothetical protein